MLASAFTLSLTSCNEWLDVKSETEDKEEDLFAKESGFKNALTGIYMSMAERNAYGQSLTMADVEELACMWFCDDFERNPAYYYLHRHEYTNDYAKENVKSIYRQLFFTITQTNVLLKNLNEHDEAIRHNRQLKALIEGEAYAVRAFCQFDVLRLFGQLPAGQGSVSVKLPYSSTTSINDIPTYFDYDTYVAKLQADVQQALTLLKESDPVMDHSLASLSYTYGVNFDDDFYYYRRTRLNYWAVKALQARIDLYLGRTAEAHEASMAVIGATTTDGVAVVSLNADSDISSGYYTLPSEHLFALSKYNVFTYSNSLLVGFGGTQVVPNQHLVMSQEMFTELFRGTDISANNRYLKLWNKSASTNQGLIYPCLSKYYYDNSGTSASMVYHTLIPMLRLSEMYLIAMETAPSVEVANALYYTYMRDHKVTPSEQTFASLSDVKDEVVKEYRREFIAEGQMFYTYKRRFDRNMLWHDNDDEITEKDYIIPLPDTEYEN